MNNDIKFIYNAIDEQNLLYARELTIRHWNFVINSLRKQTNDTTHYLETFHKFMFGDATSLTPFFEEMSLYPSFYAYVYNNFVTKVNTVQTVYGVDPTGLQKNIRYSTAVLPDSIVQRYNDGRIKAANPVEDSDVVNLLTANKNYVRTSDKKGTVYSVNENGVQNNIPFSTNPNANNIVQRDTSGGIKINDILQDDHATSKKYVDDKIKNNIEIYGMSTDFPAIGEIGKFYISTYDERMHYWNGKEYKEISSSGSDDFDVIDGGDAEEYDVTYNILDGGGA